jgi:putative transposase
LEKRLSLAYLDQSGFALMLGQCYTWATKGRPLAVRSRFASSGRTNLIGAWVIQGQTSNLYCRELKGNCTSPQVQEFIEDLTTTRQKSDQMMVIVLDNAAFHKTKAIGEQRLVWEESNVFLRFLPAYCPALNYIENVWRKIKGFLMPRRCYDSLVELRAALMVALAAIGSIII